MKAIKYEIEVCEGIIDHIHGGGYTIEEFHIPELNLYINKKAVFVTNGISNERFRGQKVQEVELTEEVVEVLAGLAQNLEQREILESLARETLKNLPGLLGS